MQSMKALKYKNPLYLAILTVLIIGIFFRFINLDKKAYWGDEAFTSLQIAGYTASELEREFFNGQVISVKDLQEYQNINPNKNLGYTIKALSKDVHPPLYYILLKFWASCFGSSVAAIRGFSAVISLLVFPSIYWLCRELFKSPAVGWIAIGLIAVSPFHLLYAQEARMYSLWTVTILLSSAALLAAIRLKTKLSWGIYAASLAIGLYSFLFTGFVAIGHGIYVFVTEGFRLSKTFIAYLFASLASLLAFTPWLLTMMANRSSFESATSWSSENMPLSSLVTNWIYNLSYGFADFWYIFTYFPNSPFNWGFGKYLIPLILILVGYSIYVLCRQTPVRIWLFVLTLMGTTTVAIVLPDLFSGGYRSIMARYFVPCYIGMELAVAYLLGTKINSIPANNWTQHLWKLLVIALLSVGVLSGTISSQAETWWSKRTTSYDEIQAASIINKASQPLFIAENLFRTLPLSHRLAPNIKILVVNQANVPKIPEEFSQVFFYQPSNNLKVKLEQEQKYKITMAYKGRKLDLWELEKTSKRKQL